MQPFHAPADRFPLLRKFAPLILVVGGLAAYGAVRPHLLADHSVALRCDPDADELTALQTTWTDIESEGEPIAGATFQFARGSAPREVITKVHARNGDFWLDLRASSPTTTTESRTLVTLGEKLTRLSVPCPSAQSSAPAPSPAASTTTPSTIPSAPAPTPSSAH